MYNCLAENCLFPPSMLTFVLDIDNHTWTSRYMRSWSLATWFYSYPRELAYPCFVAIAAGGLELCQPVASDESSQEQDELEAILKVKRRIPPDATPTYSPAGGL